MGNCCQGDSKVNESSKDGKNQEGVHKLKNGEEVDLDFYNQPENLKKIQQIQETMRNKESKKQQTKGETKGNTKKSTK